MINIKVVEQEYRLDIAVLPKKVASILEGSSLPLILSAEEIAEVIRKRTVNVKTRRTKSFNRTLLMLHKMYTTGRAPVGHTCDITKVLASIHKILQDPENKIEDLSKTGKEIASKYLEMLD